MMSLNEKIKEAREAMSMTQAELGSILGVSQSQIAQWEQPGANMTLATAIKIGLVLGLEVQVTKT